MYVLVIHRDFFVSQLFSMARHTEPAQLYDSILPLSQQTTYVSLGITKHYICRRVVCSTSVFSGFQIYRNPSHTQRYI